MVNYQNKTFKSISNSPNGEVDSTTVFQYVQQGKVVSAEYYGGGIIKGHLIATVDDKGVLDMHYHHVNNKGELMAGVCISTPEVLPTGKIRLHEKWQWTTGDNSKGESIVEEV